MSPSETRSIQRSSYYPKQDIIDFSHPCLATAADHPHYGIQGDFQQPQACETLWSQWYQYKKKAKTSKFGALSRHNMRHYHMQRLRYNPDFPAMMRDIDDFISTPQESHHVD